MNGFREENSFCYFHPKELVVGVCSLCLTERLLILSAKKGRHHVSSVRGGSGHKNPNGMHKKARISLPKIFAFSSFLNRQWKPDDGSDQEASTSQEDSFISIKFEDNGVASWEKNKVSKVSLDHCNMSWNHNFSKEAKETKEARDTKSVIEYGKSHIPLRWRKKIGHLTQLIRWKRSNKGSVPCQQQGGGCQGKEGLDKKLDKEEMGHGIKGVCTVSDTSLSSTMLICG